MNTIKIKYSIYLLLITLALILNWNGFLLGQDWGDDFAGYLLQAQTIQSGKYGQLQYYMFTNEFVLNYPWGFPLLLQPVISFFDGNYLLLKQYVYVFFILSLFFVYKLFKKEKEYALATVLLLAASPYFWIFKNNLNSDLPHLCFVMASLWCMQSMFVDKQKWIHPIIDKVILGVLIFISFEIRSQSIALLVSLLLVQIFYLRKTLFEKKNLLLNVIPYLVVCLLHLCIVLFIPIKSVKYSDAYTNYSLLDTFFNNLLYYANTWQELFTDFYYLKEIAGIITGISLLLVAIGIKMFWRTYLPALIFCCSALALVLITPFYQGLRYLMPLIPFFFFFLVKGIFHLSTLISAKFNLHVGYVCLALLSCFSLAGLVNLNTYKSTNPIIEGPYTREAIDMFNFLKQHTDTNDLIGHWKPRAMLLYSQRNAVIPHTIDECVSKKADYYVHYSEALTDQMPLDSLTAHPDWFLKIYENKKFKVFKIFKEAQFNAETKLLSKPENVEELVKKVNYLQFDSSLVLKDEKTIPVWSNEAIASSNFELEAGHYILSVHARGTEAAGVKPQCRLLANDSILGNFICEPELTRHDFKLHLSKQSTLHFKLGLENDYSTKTEDRNAFIRYILIYKAKN